MSRGRLSSDDLEDILESDNEPQQPDFYDSDEFDPASLLVQPFFDDSSGDLDSDKEEFEELKEAPVAHRSLPSPMNSGINPSSFQQHNLPMNFQNDQHQQQQQHQSNFSFQQNGMGHLSNQMHISSDSPTPDSGTHDALSPQRRAINLQVQEVQRKIQQVQQEIERVQLESNSCLVNSLSSQQQQQQQPQHQQQPLPIPNDFGLPTLVNPAGMTRSAPGRSVSMPIRRNHMQGNPISHPTFMMQQPMDLLQQQQAMMGTSNGSSTAQGQMDNMQGFRQTSNMDQLQLMMGNNSIDGSLHSPLGSSKGPVFIQGRGTMDQKHGLMTTSSLDGSYQSVVNSSHGLNQTVSLDSSGNSIITNLHGSMHNSMPGFNSQGMDNSAHSIKTNNNSSNTMNASNNMEMDPNMMMLLMQQRQQGMDNMSSMPNIAFGDGGAEMFHNSFPQVNSSGIGIMPSQGDMSGGVSSHYDLLQMQQRSFQGQGILSSPIGQQGQATGAGGQSSVNEAMEKLCESMRRSAMSRSLVKQLSGHSISRNGSARAITKQHSGRGLSRQFSGAGSSGRQIARTSSGRQGIVEVGLELPVRRSNHDPKHRLQRDVLATSSLHNPKRGVFRNHSQSAAMGGSSNKTVVNIDGNSIGMF